MTLGIGSFQFVSDLLLLALVLLGAGALFFLLSSLTTDVTVRSRMIMVGIALGVGSFYNAQLFHSWNEAFELAGNSYMASGHFFRIAYRYSEWLIVAPMFLVGFSLWPIQNEWHREISRAIFGVTVFFFLSYLTTLVSGSILILTLLFAGTISALIYTSFLFYKKIPAYFAHNNVPGKALFLRARDLLFISWLLNVVVMIFSLFPALQGPLGLVMTTIAFVVLDLVAQGGVAFCVYKIANLLPCTKFVHIEDN